MEENIDDRDTVFGGQTTDIIKEKTASARPISLLMKKTRLAHEAHSPVTSA